MINIFNDKTRSKSTSHVCAYNMTQRRDAAYPKYASINKAYLEIVSLGYMLAILRIVFCTEDLIIIYL